MQPSIPAGPDEQVFDMLMKNDGDQKNDGTDQLQDQPNVMDFDQNDPLDQADMKKSQYPMEPNYESVNPQSMIAGKEAEQLGQADNNDFSLKQQIRMREQSVIDPDKGSILLNYGLDDYKNSIWENFLGSQVQLSCTVDPDGTEKITNQNVDKLGPI